MGQIKLLLRGFLMTVRVQCLSGAVRSLLKVAVCLVVAAVTVMALSGLAGTTADALPGHPETSCQPDTPGNDPCAGATGPSFKIIARVGLIRTSWSLPCRASRCPLNRASI